MVRFSEIQQFPDFLELFLGNFRTICPRFENFGIFGRMASVLKFKFQPTNAFFATVNQMFCGTSQLPTTAEHAVIQHSRKLGGHRTFDRGLRKTHLSVEV